MTADQIAKWKAALADHHQAQRRQRYRPRARGVQAVTQAGMIRRSPPKDVPAPGGAAQEGTT